MFSQFFINRPIFASVISIVIVLIGLVALPAMPVEKTPNITPPTVKVTATYPGASGQVIAETVTAPIEEKLNGVDNMLYISSKSSDDGQSEITVTFEVGTDIDMATVLVQNRVALAQSALPEEVKREGVTVEKQSTNMTLIIGLTSTVEQYDDIYLSNYITTRIKDVLARIPGVGNVTIFGSKDFGMRIWLDPKKLAARDLTTLEVYDAIREQNVQVAAGQIGAPPTPQGQNFQYTVSTSGRLKDVEQFENIVVKTGKEGQLLLLKDVARVELGAQTYAQFVQLNEEPSVAIGIYQQPGANALTIAEDVIREMDQLKANFPKGLHYEIPYNPTIFITTSIDEVIETLLIAVLLVIFTVFVFLQDWRTTIIPTLAIPVSLIGTLGVMLAMGMSINTLTLFGLVLAIGIVVDDAIVVVENTMRLIDTEGLSPKKAAEKAMVEVTGPVIATTLVLLAVFVPTAMMSGITGQLYSQFAMTIATATVFSSINALTLAPALCGVLLRPTPKKRNFLFTAYNRLFDYATNGYVKGVKISIRLMAFSLIAFVGTLVLTGYSFTLVPGGFIPDEDQGVFFVQVILPDGASLERTKEITDRVNKIIQQTPEVSQYLTIGGFSMMNGTSQPNTGTYFVSLKHWDNRKRHINEIIEELQIKMATIQEAICFCFAPPPIDGLGNATGFDFQLQDRSDAGLTLLETIGQDMVTAGAQTPTLARLSSNLKTNVPQFFLDIDRTKAKKLGVPLNNIFMTLQTYLGSSYVNDFNLFGRVYRVIIQADAPYRSKYEDILQLKVRNKNGDMIPLNTLMVVNDTVGPQFVMRYNLYPSTQITGQPKPGYSSSQAIKEMEKLAAQTLPPSMGYQWSGVTYQQLAAGNQAPMIFGLAILLVFLFLAAQYESWTIPLAVILSVPLGLLGAMGSVWLRGGDNNIYTQIGLVLLIGLASKSAIMIVEFAKQRRSEGLSVREAAIDAARLRFRPILMTAFSFILGVIPLVIASGAGAESRKSLGTAVFGGMLLATVIGVFLIPVLYAAIQGASEKLFGSSENE